MKTQIRNERMSLTYSGGKMVLQNSKMRIVITASPEKINLSLGGKPQNNVLVDAEFNS